MPLTYEPKIDAVLDGRIKQTIRKKKKRVYRVNDKILMHGWEGKPYYSKWSWRRNFVIVEVFTIYLLDEFIGTEYREHRWESSWADNLAKRDGIISGTGPELKRLMEETNGPDWEGEYWVIRWEKAKQMKMGDYF